MTDTTNHVTIGGETRTIGRFKSYRVALAAEIIGNASDAWRELLAEVAKYRRDYIDANKVKITREMAVDRAGEFRAAAAGLRRQAEGTDDETDTATLEGRAAQLESRAASWEQTAAEMGEKPWIELPGAPPSDEEELLFVIPLALRTMKEQVVQLVALAIIPNNELLTAWRDDAVWKKLEDYGYGLLEELELGEEIELAVAVREIVEAQLRPHKEAIAKLKALYGRQDSPKEIEETTETEDSTSESPTSSTPSPTPTSGDPKTSSSDSRTAPTEPSLAA